MALTRQTVAVLLIAAGLGLSFAAWTVTAGMVAGGLSLSVLAAVFLLELPDGRSS